MNKQTNKRRHFLRASLAVPLLSNLAVGNKSVANTVSGSMVGDSFLVPENIYHDLFEIYGGEANNIVRTDKLTLKAPDLAENGAVVGLSVVGENGLVSSLAIFVAENPKPLASTCKLHEGADLAVGLRVKMGRTSDIYVVAQTNDGLVGTKKTIKVTIGCGGG